MSSMNHRTATARALLNRSLRRARIAPHRPDRRRTLGADLALHLEPVATVERDVLLLARLEVRGNALLVAASEHRLNKSRTDALALVLRISAEYPEVPVRFRRMGLL